LKVLKCNRCNNIWQYKGTNPYCANCSKCKSTVFIKKSSLHPLSNNGLRDGYRKEEEKRSQEISQPLNE